jgi:hypothetical protein
MPRVQEHDPPDKLPESRALNLGYELEFLRRALGAAEVLTATLGRGGLEDEPQEHRALVGVGAVITLVICRLGDLSQVANGLLDPAAILGEHNQAIPGVESPGEFPELRMPCWSLRRRRRWLKAELRRVRIQLRQEGQAGQDDPAPAG